MPPFQLLLLDANVIIKAHELGIWEQLINRCHITISRSVAEDEANYWEDSQGIRYNIDLAKDIQAGRVNCENVSIAKISEFRELFDLSYLDRMDPGETESLAILYFKADEHWMIASSDAIVFKILGNIKLGDRGISLEEILTQIGLQQKLPFQHTQRFRRKYTKEGEQDSIRGRGLKSK